MNYIGEAYINNVREFVKEFSKGFSENEKVSKQR